MDKIAQKTDMELHNILREKRESLRKFRFDMTGSKVKNVKEGKILKREIAAILTEVNTRKANAKN